MSDAPRTLEPETVYEREIGVLWRLLADRVLIHRVDAVARLDGVAEASSHAIAPDTVAADLVGPVALVWLALDEPASASEVRARLAEESLMVVDVEADLERLCAAALIRPVGSQPARAATTALDHAVAQSSSGGTTTATVGVVAVYDTLVWVTASPPLHAELRSALADLLVDGPGDSAERCADVAAGRIVASHRLDVELADGVWTVRRDGVSSYVGPSIDLALYDALIVLNHHATDTAIAAGRVVLHGGAVQIAGRATVVVGHSGSGKSTLTAALTMAGHPFLADEVVAIDDGLVVESFHRPIGLRAGGLALLDVPAPVGPYGSTMPWRARSPRCHASPLGLVAILRRSETPCRGELRELTPAQALCELANQTLGQRGGERAMFRRLDAFVRSARVAELVFYDLADAVAVLENCSPGPPSRVAER